MKQLFTELNDTLKMEITTKDKFKAILKLKGIDHKRLAKIMGMSPEYTKILLSRSNLCPSYMKLVVHLFEKSLDH